MAKPREASIYVHTQGADGTVQRCGGGGSNNGGVGGDDDDDDDDGLR